MKVVIAIDSFKGSMSSIEAGNAAKKGVLAVCPDADVVVLPVADGGEGTAEALYHAKKDEASMNKQEIMVTGPLGDKVMAEYVILGKTAIIEMAAAAGLPLVPQDKRNPMNTTTYGVGEMIVDAMNKGCDDFIVGIGGSATNDGGTGMLSALGYDFFDGQGRNIGYGGNGLEKLEDIGFENVIYGLNKCSFHIACDVDNPLLGERGCSRVFAPQKGASAVDIERMEKALKKYADITEHVAGCDMGYLHSIRRMNMASDSKTMPDRNTPGCGAAGGMGYAFIMYTRAELLRGVDIILNYISAEDVIKDADLVITGEGKIDSQTLMGKTPAGVAELAKKYHVPVYAFAGMLGDGYEKCLESGIFDKCIQIKNEDDELEYIMRSDVAMERLAERVSGEIKVN